MKITNKPVSEEDQPFLYRLFATTRERELAFMNGDEARKDMFLKFQFEAQSSDFQTRFAGAEHHIILCDDQPVGQIMVYTTEEKILLVDISVLPEFRGKGIGREQIERLQAEARQKKLPVYLHVMKNNPAIHLYRRSGFVITDEDHVCYEMVWNPTISQ